MAMWRAVLLCFFVNAALAQQFNVRDDVPWFKARQSIRDRLINGGLKGKNAACTASRSGTAVQGVCTNLKECVVAGGNNAGSCSLLGTCCIIERSCANRTSAKVSYFVSPTVIQQSCPFTINLFSRSVCQIRLDFERFNLAQPTQANPDSSAYECLTDSFIVTSTASTNLGFTSLCGYNDGQHIYIPVNATQSGGAVSLQFQLATTRNGTTPEWRIRVTQLECTPNSIDFSSVQSALVSMYQKHKNKKNNNVLTDAQLIAPAGCLQYYTALTGNYSTFNYFGSRVGSRYIGNLNYAICFRRTNGVCGVRHTGQSFLLNGNTANSAGQWVDSSTCIDNSQAPSTTNSRDYLFIPGGRTSSGNIDEYYCANALDSTTSTINNNPVTSSVPGPLYVVFSSDNFNNGQPEEGFLINYELLTSGCTTTFG